MPSKKKVPAVERSPITVLTLNINRATGEITPTVHNGTEFEVLQAVQNFASQLTRVIIQESNKHKGK